MFSWVGSSASTPPATTTYYTVGILRTSPPNQTLYAHPMPFVVSDRIQHVTSILPVAALRSPMTEYTSSAFTIIAKAAGPALSQHLP